MKKLKANPRITYLAWLLGGSFLTLATPDRRCVGGRSFYAWVGGVKPSSLHR
jgi:hypothetical protein